MADFEPALTSSVQMEIPTNSDGNIATTSETQTGIKRMSIEGISAAATLSQAATIFDTFFYTICNADFDSLSAKKTTVQEVNN